MSAASIALSSPLVLRRAVEDDYKAVLDIRPNLWDGSDYLSTCYFTYFHDNRHVLYVLEQDGQLISLVNYELSRDGSHVMTMSMRVRQSHEGRGLSADKYPEFKVKLLAEFPNVTHEMQSLSVEEKFAKKIRESTVLNRWGFVSYRIPVRATVECLSVRSINSSVINFSYSESVDWLTSSDIFSHFFHSHDIDYISTSTTWKAVKVDDKIAMKEFFATNTVYATLGDDQTDLCDMTPGNEFDVERGNGDDASRGDNDYEILRRNSMKDVHGITPSRQISSLSYSYIILLSSYKAVLLHIFYFGDAHALSDHVTSQLLRACSVCDEEFSFNECLFHYSPQLISASEVERCLDKECGLEEFLLTRGKRREAVMIRRPIRKT